MFLFTTWRFDKISQWAYTRVAKRRNAVRLFLKYTIVMCSVFNRGVLKSFCKQPSFPYRVSRCSNKPWEPEWWHDRKNGLRTERLADSRRRIATIYTAHWEDSNRENQTGKLEETRVIFLIYIYILTYFINKSFYRVTRKIDFCINFISIIFDPVTDQFYLNRYETNEIKPYCRNRLTILFIREAKKEWANLSTKDG